MRGMGVPAQCIEHNGLNAVDFNGSRSLARISLRRWRSERQGCILPSMTRFDQTDYSVVVKHRAPPPNPWRWEIYRAGTALPIERSSIFFHSMGTAIRAGKEALKQRLDKLHA